MNGDADSAKKQGPPSERDRQNGSATAAGGHEASVDASLAKIGHVLDAPVTKSTEQQNVTNSRGARGSPKLVETIANAVEVDTDL